jgi:hypothetical protein
MIITINTIIFIRSINKLMFVIEKQSVSCREENEFLDII